MTEFDLIARYFAPLTVKSPGARGLQDDAAVMSPPPGFDLVITKDMIAENIHFLSDDPAETVAHKLLAVNLSDLAAMGAAPMGCVLGLGIPKREDTISWIATFAEGLGRASAHFACPLLGGDTISGLERWTLSLTAFGLVPTGTALSRAGAALGDILCVSGTIGAAKLGLAALRSGRHETDWIARYQKPTPQLALGQALRGLASACADVSDGLLADAGHIGAASGLAIEVDLARVPHFADQDALEAATAGDDYELVFTVPPEKMDQLLTLSKDLELKITVVGKMMAGIGVRVRDAHGALITPERLGYQHG